jgi:hypothetical protein
MIAFNFESRWLGRRGEAPPLPSWSRWAPLLLLRWGAQLRRYRGRYDPFTLALFRRIWARSRHPRALLAYVMFRRDLGLPLMKWHVPLLAQALGQLSRSQRRFALNLLAEAQSSSAQPSAVLTTNGGRGKGGENSIEASIRAKQTDWRPDFANWLRQRSANGICVVGNANRMIGAGLGDEIDQHGVVVRFNQFRESSSSLADIGTRMDVWVTSPGFSGAVPPGVEWVVVSGPEMAFRLQDWRRFEAPQRLGVKILTVPLQPWSELVKRFEAPPSAGLLFLAWSQTLLGSWSPIRALGFGVTNDGDPSQHVLAHHRPSGRHNWPAEQTLLRAWQAKGLRVQVGVAGTDPGFSQGQSCESDQGFY